VQSDSVTTKPRVDTQGMVIKNNSRIESRLLFLAAIFLSLYSLILTFSPIVRTRSADTDVRWEHWMGFFVWLACFSLIHYFASRRLISRDPFLIPIAALLTGWGVLTVWRLYPDYGARQTIWLCVASAILILGMSLKSDLNFLRRYKYLWLSGGLILTALTLVFGTNPLGYGPRLWLGCCGIYLQPSEPLKLLLIVYLAAYLADRLLFILQEKVHRGPLAKRITPWLPLLAPTVIMTGFALIILIVQRDLGTATIFLVLYTSLIFVSSGRNQFLLISLTLLIFTGLIGYFYFELVEIRIEAWLNPWLDPSGNSYQIVQSLLAIANGGLIGRGPGLGNPTLVPISHSDFVFAAITEEGGLIGSLALLILVALLAQRGISIALKASNSFLRYLAAGLTTYLIFQSVLIIGGNLRLLPLTGVTLPFVSYGGSSLVVSFISLLLLLHISNKTYDQPAQLFNRKPYQLLGAFLFIGIAGLTIALGWWAFYRGPDLLTRTDNPRRTISDLFVKRGSILDRDSNPISESIGTSGLYQRNYLYPDLSPVVGYTNPVYGQSGLEASMDETLRGLRGNPGLKIWWDHLLYGQPPPGLDIRISINIDIQQAVDRILGDNKGAIIVLNADNGEILGMASHPTYDSNKLDVEWEELIHDSNTPLVNRVTQSIYPAGTALAALVLAETTSYGMLPSSPRLPDSQNNETRLDCATLPEDGSWQQAIINGCQSAYQDMLASLGGDKFSALLDRTGIYAPVDIRLPNEKPIVSSAKSIIDQEIWISPFHLAVALSPLSANGVRAAPILVTSINTTSSGWVPITAFSEPLQVMPSSFANSTALKLEADDLPFWETVSIGEDPADPETQVSWYIAGTTQDWPGAPLVIVVLIEENNPQLAKGIGRQVIESVISP